ncbi:hypothetical protein UCDDS831_g08654 [Diplodia seriata]|uniref:Rhodopsin domain-containing protein n=1 Tax=Diplodia seriata TaxID=420778 RepID=A0A0G2DT34_9PEZI|nr:hypothetical protein UCDDS831_g08654 [Diplodia seriata]
MVFVMQPLAIGFIKLSFLFFYRRIFFVYKSFQVISLILVAITVAWIIAFFFGFTFACGINFATNWASLSEIGEKCGFGFMATVVYSILDAALDFIILILPFPWGITSAGIFWTVIETNVALIACCLPTLHSLIKPTAFGAAISRPGAHTVS